MSIPCAFIIWRRADRKLDKIPGDDEEEHDVVIELED
jgi:hypothetical protein